MPERVSCTIGYQVTVSRLIPADCEHKSESAAQSGSCWDCTHYRAFNAPEREYWLLPHDEKAGMNLTDTDIWGLVCALEHGIRDGYMGQNQEWAKAMSKRLSAMRDPDGDREITG